MPSKALSSIVSMYTEYCGCQLFAMISSRQGRASRREPPLPPPTWGWRFRGDVQHREARHALRLRVTDEDLLGRRRAEGLPILEHRAVLHQVHGKSRRPLRRLDQSDAARLQLDLAADERQQTEGNESDLVPFREPMQADP